MKERIKLRELKKEGKFEEALVICDEIKDISKKEILCDDAIKYYIEQKELDNIVEYKSISVD